MSSFEQPAGSTNRMMAGISIRCVSRNHVTHPSEPSASPEPNSGCDDQPEEPAKYFTVVDLTDAGNEEAQYGCDAWVSHAYSRLKYEIFDKKGSRYRPLKV